MKTAAEKAAEAIEREYSNADGFSPVHAEHMTPFISREYQELEKAVEAVLDDPHGALFMSEPETEQLIKTLRSALAKVRGN